MRMKTVSFVVVLMLMTVMAVAQGDPAVDSVNQVIPPAPPTSVQVVDHPNDHGHALDIFWKPSADDGTGKNTVIGYRIMRATSPDGPFEKRGEAAPGDSVYVDQGPKEKDNPAYFPNNTDFYYKVIAYTLDSEASSEVVGPAHAYGQWFNMDRIPVLVAVVLFAGFMLFFISKARKGADLYIRPLAGIEAVDEAIGRATEMGKPILYVLGLGTASDIATIASFTILGRVAKKVAEYQTSLICPCYDPIVMTVAQETVKTAYYDAGRPDAYHQDMVYFVTQSQFAYVAAVNGTMLRELPATNLYLGKFYAESLMLAETGALAGSIQISGTDEIAQIPFFVVACDYTLIGEELYAASAYLGKEPMLLGTLKAQDYAKALVIICAIIGVLAAIFGWTDFIKLFEVPG